MDSEQSTSRPVSSPSIPRSSTLYEYHNAPEVAPAHGLEYDDTPYPVSDKYPVVRHQHNPPAYSGSQAYDAATRSPRIIFGMKIKTFILVAILFVLIVVGAAVGGAVGGKNMNGGNTKNQLEIGSSSSSSSSSSSASSTSASTSATVTPTYTPLTDCPGSNDTTYTSSYSTSTSDSNLTFTKYCDVTSPLSNSNLSVRNITEAFVYTFDDCIEICAGYNLYASGANCTVAVYDATGSRPADCWIGAWTGYADGASTLNETSGIAVALLSS